MLERGSEPMLILEYMDHGSLYDVLHNDTMPIESNLLLHILQDVSQGVRFLHSSIPQVVHGDLKSVRFPASLFGSLIVIGTNSRVFAKNRRTSWSTVDSELRLPTSVFLMIRIRRDVPVLLIGWRQSC